MEAQTLRESFMDAIRYWEPLRLVYNSALAIIVLIFFWIGYPHSRVYLSADAIVLVFPLAVLANVAYCTAYLVDILVQSSGYREIWRKKEMDPLRDWINVCRNFDAFLGGRDVCTAIKITFSSAKKFTASEKGNISMPHSTRVALTIAFVLFFSRGLVAQTPEVRVLASNGIKAVVEDLRAQSERAIGHPLSVEYRPTANLKQEIEAGAPFDVVIVTAESVAQLSKEGKTLGGEGTPISRVGVGIGIRKGAPRPDISTPEALKRALLGTKVIAYGPVGASYPYITKMLDTLGIADTMKPKTLFFDTSDGTNGAVLQGKADFGITLVSEILPVQGLELLGPFPEAFQGYVRFTAAISANAKNHEAAQALIQFLAGPDALASIKARGMQAH